MFCSENFSLPVNISQCLLELQNQKCIPMKTGNDNKNYFLKHNFKGLVRLFTYFLNFVEAYSLSIMYCSIQEILNVIAYLALINAT